MVDIVPELLDKIKSDFDDVLANDRQIERFLDKVAIGKADLTDVHGYSVRLGENLSDVLMQNLTPEQLPDKTLYFNIADRTVRPMMEQNHKLINQIAVEVQKVIDQADGIGLKALEGDEPAKRIKGLIDKLVESEYFTRWLGEPVVNTTESFFDDFIRKNADFRSKAGMLTYIERMAAPDGVKSRKLGKGKYFIPCDWCQGLEGKYIYPDQVSDEVFQRHEFCRCVVTYKSEKMRQDVWSKKTWFE